MNIDLTKDEAIYIATYIGTYRDDDLNAQMVHNEVVSKIEKALKSEENFNLNVMWYTDKEGVERCYTNPTFFDIDPSEAVKMYHGSKAHQVPFSVVYDSIVEAIKDYAYKCRAGEIVENIPESVEELEARIAGTISYWFKDISYLYSFFSVNVAYSEDDENMLTVRLLKPDVTRDDLKEIPASTSLAHRIAQGFKIR